MEKISTAQSCGSTSPNGRAQSLVHPRHLYGGSQEGLTRASTSPADMLMRAAWEGRVMGEGWAGDCAELGSWLDPGDVLEEVSFCVRCMVTAWAAAVGACWAGPAGRSPIRSLTAGS